jgi:hypothetical protein
MSLALATVVLLGQFSSAEDIQGSLPTLLEEYANRPTTNFVYSQETSHLSSGQTRITITAIVIEVREQPPKRMQGIRIDLAGENGTDRVYLDADEISVVLQDIRQLQRDIEMFPMEQEAGHMRGTARCAPGSPVLHTVCPEYVNFGDSSGIALRSTRKGQWFPLPGFDLQQLADAIRGAIPVLKSAEQ